MPVLGVLGTMVWDEICRDSEPHAPVEEWGGISYALAGAEAACAPDWTVRPIVKVGRDLSESAFRFLRELSTVEDYEGVLVVDQPNTRVELTYRSSVRRCERIMGGVPRWTWPELEAHVAGCDALYVNFITGGELGLRAAQELRRGFQRPIYADFHSLLLATGPGGKRELKPLDRWADWVSCFDIVQMNEDELRTLSAHWGDPWRFAASIVGRDTRVLFVTLGPRGAAYVMARGAVPMEWEWGSGAVEPAVSGRLDTEPVRDGDPTGCGDVWGITCCCAVMAGSGVEEAIRAANAAATRSVRYRGATGLASFLLGEVSGG